MNNEQQTKESYLLLLTALGYQAFPKESTKRIPSEKSYPALAGGNKILSFCFLRHIGGPALGGHSAKLQETVNYFTASLRVLPAVNFGTVIAGIVIAALV